MDQLANNNLLNISEVNEILNLLKNTSEYDLSGYRKASLKRRIERFLVFEKMNYHELKDALTNTPNFSTFFVQELSVIVTEMFRDPEFFEQLKDLIFNQLDQYKFIRVWSAGTGTGEEAYSLAIILKEKNLLHKSFIYATDINKNAIEKAKKGIYTLKKIKSYTDNYNRVRNPSEFSSHYTAMYNAAIINQEYRSKILFSTHNLTTGQVFNEFQLILCRNVLIYFEKELQERVLQLLYNSLTKNGIICLGNRENLTQHSISHLFKVIDKTHNIYQKIA